MCDTNNIRIDVQIQLEEEMDKIILLADSLKGRPLTAARQSLSAKKRQNGLKNPGKNSLLVPQTKQKKARSSCIAKMPLILRKRPRLSPLAARAALAAAVAPLRQARKAILFEKSQNSSEGSSARCKVHTSCMVVAEDDPCKLHVFIKEKGQNTSVAVATPKRGCRCTAYCSLVQETGDTCVHGCVCEIMEKNDVELIIDIPIYEDLLSENAIALSIDIPIFKL